jgi:hypothetical protein
MELNAQNGSKGDQPVRITWNELTVEQAALELSHSIADVEATVADLERAQQVSQQTLESKISV